MTNKDTKQPPIVIVMKEGEVRIVKGAKRPVMIIDVDMAGRSIDELTETEYGYAYVTVHNPELTSKDTKQEQATEMMVAYLPADRLPPDKPLEEYVDQLHTVPGVRIMTLDEFQIDFNLGELSDQAYIRIFEQEASPKQCDHDWRWHYDCFEDAVEDEGHQITIPVRCNKCGAEGRRVYLEDDVIRITDPNTE